MFIDPYQYSFLSRISQELSVIEKELMGAVEGHKYFGDVLSVPMTVDFHSNQWAWENGINRDAIGYDLKKSGYSMLAIYKKDQEVNAMGAQQVFKETLRLLREVKGIYYAAFTALSPGAHLGLHSHNRRHLIFHILMNDLIDGGCEMICNGDVRMMKKAGDMVLFDYSLPHESISHSSNVRINLMIDFRP